MADLIRCPFCGEEDFDRIGLKLHFQRGWCDAFNETPNTDRPEPVESTPPNDPANGVAPAQAPSGDCVAIGGLKGRTVAYVVYAGSENGTASVQFFFNDGTGFVISASGKMDVLNFHPVEQIPGSLADGVEARRPTPEQIAAAGRKAMQAMREKFPGPVVSAPDHGVPGTFNDQGENHG